MAPTYVRFPLLPRGPKFRVFFHRVGPVWPRSSHTCWPSMTPRKARGAHQPLHLRDPGLARCSGCWSAVSEVDADGGQALLSPSHTVEPRRTR